MTGLLLALWAFVLVNPGASWVRRWRFLRRVPRAAIVLWQAGTVSALVATVGAGLWFGWLLWEHRPDSTSWLIVTVIVVVFAVHVVVRLVWSVASVLRASERRRARHRAAVDLLARVADLPDLPDLPGLPEDLSRGLRVLASAEPLAYCLPGVRSGRVVVSEGTVASLSPKEFEAVLAHECAHLRARHDVVLDSFTAVHRAFPFGVRSDVALRECRHLIELSADDVACAQVGEVAVARALVAMAGSPVPPAAIGMGGGELATTTERVARLARNREEPRLAAGVLALAAALVAFPVVVLTARELLPALL